MDSKRNSDLVAAFAPPGHFYSPHPAIEDVERQYEKWQTANRQTVGLNLNETGQLELLRQFSTAPIRPPWQDKKSSALLYYYDNPFFRNPDGLALFGFIQHFKPRVILEIGSGYSTACAIDSCAVLGLNTQVTCIEPYPERLMDVCGTNGQLPVKLHREKLQSIPIDIFLGLEENDILFIDSTHVAKFGSDVIYILFHILSALRRGVIVHIHDIFWPFEYPLDWFREGRAWNEAYFMRAFLMYNDNFGILRFNSYLQVNHHAQLHGLFPHLSHETGGSLWIRKEKN